MALQPGTTIARYTILGRLAIGGMSEIYLARHTGPKGFAKTVVIKVILPHLAEDPKFRRMFTNEARLAALINHANVVQIFDFGVEGDDHFIAMEHIDGQTLRRIQKRRADTGMGIPAPVALRIIADTAGALEHAHSLTDASGSPLGIIHRDVSLDNILLTHSGQVKLVDFGIAKAAILDGSTAQGTLKGRYHYMPPEQIRSQSLDHRIDIYSLGVVAYSLLVGQLPYQADNLRRLFNVILYSDPPRPTEAIPDLPVELEQIVLRAMQKDRSKRFARAADLQEEIERYLAETGEVVMPFHLGQFMAETYPPGTDPDRETYRKLAGSAPGAPDEAVPTELDVELPEVIAQAAQEQEQEQPSSASGVGPPPRSAVGLVVALTVLGALALGAVAFLALRRPDPAATTPETVIVDSHLLSRDLPRPRDMAPPDSARPAVDLRPVQAPPVARKAPAAGHLSVEGSLPGLVYLDKRRIGSLPVKNARVRPGRHRLLVQGRRPRYELSRVIHVGPGQHQRIKLAPRKGTIRVMARPWALVMLNGKVVGSTPIKPVSVYEGKHRLTLINSELKTKKQRQVSVQPGKEVLVKVRMNR